MVFNPKADPRAIRLSRLDVNEPLSSYSKHSFELDGHEWPSVEHYYQAAKFEDEKYKQKILSAAHPREATKLGEVWFKPKKSNWKAKRIVMMTRGVYIKCRTHEEIAAKLLATGDELIVDTSQFDYYWGIGRDGRGENHYGEVLMAVRNRLREEQA